MSDSDLSLYEIAYHLRLPLYVLLNEMPYDELLGWYDYFERRPVEWRADDRAAKLLQAQGVKEKPQALFSSLAAIYNPKKTITEGDGTTKSLRGSVLLHKMLQAEGGVTLDL